MTGIEKKTNRNLRAARVAADGLIDALLKLESSNVPRPILSRWLDQVRSIAAEIDNEEVAE
jgi:hypothetical protein